MGSIIEGLSAGVASNVPGSVCAWIVAMAVLLVFFWAIIKILMKEVERTNKEAIESIQKSYDSTLKNNADTIKQLLNKIN